MPDANRKPFRKMSRAEIEADRREFFAIQARLKAMGWVHTMSIMDDCGTGGLHHEKDGREFVLNASTRDNLPTD